MAAQALLVTTLVPSRFNTVSRVLQVLFKISHVFNNCQGYTNPEMVIQWLNSYNSC